MKLIRKHSRSSSSGLVLLPETFSPVSLLVALAAAVSAPVESTQPWVLALPDFPACPRVVCDLK
jgi:hypothetical protein